MDFYVPKMDVISRNPRSEVGLGVAIGIGIEMSIDSDLDPESDPDSDTDRDAHKQRLPVLFMRLGAPPGQERLFRV